MQKIGITTQPGYITAICFELRRRTEAVCRLVLSCKGLKLIELKSCLDSALDAVLDLLSSDFW